MIYELELPEQATDTVHVMVGWYDDVDCFYVERCEPGDTDREAHQQEGDVPAELWARHIAAYNLVGATVDEIAALVGAIEGGLAAQPCPEWKGNVHEIPVSWYLMLSASGDDDTWPLRDVQIGWSYESWAAAEAALDALPAEFYLCAGGGAPGPQLISRDRLTIRKAFGRELVSDCEHCGHDRSAHAGADQ